MPGWCAWEGCWTDDCGVLVLPAISTENLTAKDVDELARTTRELMLEELGRLTELARAQRVAMTSAQTGLLDDDENDGAVKATGRERPPVSPGL